MVRHVPRYIPFAVFPRRTRRALDGEQCFGSLPTTGSEL